MGRIEVSLLNAYSNVLQQLNSMRRLSYQSASLISVHYSLDVWRSIFIFTNQKWVALQKLYQGIHSLKCDKLSVLPQKLNHLLNQQFFLWVLIEQTFELSYEYI